MGVHQYFCDVNVLHSAGKYSEPSLDAIVFHEPLLGQWTGLDSVPPKFMFSLELQIVTLFGNRASADVSR